MDKSPLSTGPEQLGACPQDSSERAAEAPGSPGKAFQGLMGKGYPYHGAEHTCSQGVGEGGLKRRTGTRARGQGCINGK